MHGGAIKNNDTLACLLKQYIPWSSNVNQALDWGALRLYILFKGVLTAKMLRNTFLD